MANDQQKSAEAAKPAAPVAKPAPDQKEILSVLKEVHVQALARGGRDDPTTMKLTDILERLEPPEKPKAP